MPIRIDRMETSVEVAPPESGGERRREHSGTAEAPVTLGTGFREAVAQVLADELAEYSRMRGH